MFRKFKEHKIKIAVVVVVVVVVVVKKYEITLRLQKMCVRILSHLSQSIDN